MSSPDYNNSIFKQRNKISKSTTCACVLRSFGGVFDAYADVFTNKFTKKFADVFINKKPANFLGFPLTSYKKKSKGL